MIKYRAALSFRHWQKNVLRVLIVLVEKFYYQALTVLHLPDALSL